MKIKFKAIYKLINKNFGEKELPDFTIITGKNGVGKTQLLEGLTNNKFMIDNGDGTANFRVIYFDYNKFIVKNRKPETEQQLKQNDIEHYGATQDINKIQNQIHNEIFTPMSTKYKNFPDVMAIMFHHIATQRVDFIDNIISFDEVDNLAKEQIKSIFDYNSRKRVYAEFIKRDLCINQLKNQQTTNLVK